MLVFYIKRQNLHIIIRQYFDDFMAKIREPSNAVYDTKVRYLYIHSIFSKVIDD